LCCSVSSVSSSSRPRSSWSLGARTRSLNKWSLRFLVVQHTQAERRPLDPGASRGRLRPSLSFGLQEPQEDDQTKECQEQHHHQRR
jgi:hypothetical protein